jgi:hypothetical protein
MYIRKLRTKIELQASTESILAAVGNVQEAVLVLVLLVDVRHKSSYN